MNDENKIALSAMQNRLQAIEHYDNPEQAFETLLYGWSKKRRINAARLHYMKETDAMPAHLARDFALYCGYPIDRDT